ncbi:hypothetical protein Tco_0261681, partial [Tanacetum coccineum]
MFINKTKSLSTNNIFVSKESWELHPDDVLDRLLNGSISGRQKPKKSKVLQAHSGDAALRIQSWFLNTALENTKERKMSGTVNRGASTVVGVFAHVLFGGMKEASAFVV